MSAKSKPGEPRRGSSDLAYDFDFEEGMTPEYLEVVQTRARAVVVEGLDLAHEFMKAGRVTVEVMRFKQDVVIGVGVHAYATQFGYLGEGELELAGISPEERPQYMKDNGFTEEMDVTYLELDPCSYAVMTPDHAGEMRVRLTNPRFRLILH